MININGNSNDMNNRYKMEKISLNNCGNGNGLFTIINNMDNIAKSINTPSDILYKYLVFELGSAFNEKKKSLTGMHSVETIQQHLYNYINKFVICPNCNIPELMYKIENKKVCSSCSACHKINNIQSGKVLDLIEKYLVKNKEWIKSKGLIVEQKQEISDLLVEQKQDSKQVHVDSDDFNPFS
jgi:translation initiation factor 5